MDLKQQSSSGSSKHGLSGNYEELYHGSASAVGLDVAAAASGGTTPGAISARQRQRPSFAWRAAAGRRLSFLSSGAPSDSSEANLRGRSGVAINKLTTDQKWVERRLTFDEESGSLRISTQKVLAPETRILLNEVAYVQVGAEELEEQHRDMVEPLKTRNNSPASIFISAGESSVRIRVPDEEAAALLAAEIRELVQQSSSAREALVIDEEHVHDLMQDLTKKLRSGTAAPSLFAVVQLLGAECHRNILKQQEKCAGEILADPVYGPRLSALKHPEVDEGMRQRVALTVSSFLNNICVAEGFGDALDEEILPAVMCAISSKVRPLFQEALLRAVPSAELHGGGGGGGSRASVGSGASELKVGPTKRANRVTVKIVEYRKQKNEWPNAQFVTDVMRASYICETAEEFVQAYEGIEASDQFEIVRLKNKIGKCQGPFNLHVNVLFHPAECKDPILTEIQFYPKAVFDLQHRQHLAYELKRASSVEELL